MTENKYNLSGKNVLICGGLGGWDHTTQNS